MKAILEFNLEEPFEMEAHMRAIKSADLCFVLTDLQNFIRTKRKYEDKESITLDELSEKLVAIMDEYNIDLNELIS